MKLLAHFIAADGRRLRWTVTGWFLVTTIAVAWQAAAPFIVSPAMGAQRPADMVMGLAWFAQVLVGATLLPMVIHGHPAVGTTAFWMTRPLPRGALAGSKLVLLFLLFVLFPALCDAALMSTYGVPPRLQMLALLEASGQRSLLVLLGAAIAVMTATFPHFLLTMGIAIGTVVVGINLWFMLEFTRDDIVYSVAVSSGSQIWSPFRGPDPTPAAVMLVVAAIFASAVVVVQYRRRSRPRSLSVVATGVLVVASIGMAWPAGARHVAPPDWGGDSSKGRLLSLGSSVYFDSDPSRSWNVQGGVAVGRGDVALADIPEGWLSATRLRRATLQLDGGQSIESREFGFGAVLPVADERAPVAVALKRVVGVDTIAWGDTGPANEAVLLALPRSKVPPLGSSGRYAGTFAIDLSRISVAAVLPLNRSTTFDEGAHRLTLVGASLSEMGPRVRVRLSDASPALDASPGRAYYYFVRNRSAGQAIGGQQQYWGTSLVGFLPVGNMYVTALLPFSARSDEFLFPALSPETRKLRIDEQWMRGAELVVVKVEQAGTIERTLELPRLHVAQRGAQ
jgi:hypothetical protein